MNDRLGSTPGVCTALEPPPADARFWTRSRTPEQQQRLRMLRFGAASATYGLGLLILGVYAALGRLAWPRLLVIAAGFLLINVVFLFLFLGRINLRFKDPSLTLAQVLTAGSSVALILLSSPRLDPIAVPFYSVLFFFAMLRLSSRDLIKVGAYVIVTYAAAVALRLRWYGSTISPGDEGITALLVVASTIWFASAASYISRLRQRLKDTAARLEQLASCDSLTGLWNRHRIESLLLLEAQRAERAGEPLAILLADLDRFKEINDRFGHAVGDDALRDVAVRIGSTLRAGAHVGRWGGEEFLIVLPGASLEQARTCAQRIRRELESSGLETDRRLAVTASIGLALWSPPEPLPALLSRADRAMYQAKLAGRNRVVVLEHDEQIEPCRAMQAGHCT